MEKFNMVGSEDLNIKVVKELPVDVYLMSILT